MLAKPGPIPAGDGYGFELKWDGFRALVSTVEGLRIRSRRGWNMAPLLPELGELPDGVVLDGELVAFVNGAPYFPHVCERLLYREDSIPICFVAFDLLRLDGESLLDHPFVARRRLLEHVARAADNRVWRISDLFDDGALLFAAVCAHGLEGIVAKKLTERYRPGERRWIKTKNRDYWRRDQEVEAAHSRTRDAWALRQTQ